MNIDPTINMVVFVAKLNGKKEQLVADGLTKSPDCVATVWNKLKKEHRLIERDILEIYSEWEPSPSDAKFISKHFPNVKVSYSFERPPDNQWDAAIAKVKKIMEEAEAKKLMEQSRQEAKGFSPLPILRNADGFSDMVVSAPLIPELTLFLANVGTTSRGTIGIDYVMLGKVKEEGLDVAAMWEQAFVNLAKGLTVNRVKQNSDQFFTVQHTTGIAVSAIGLPDFPNNAEKWVGSRRIILGIQDPATLVLCAADTKLAKEIQDKVLKSPYIDAVNLTPSVLLLAEGKLSLLARRTTP